LPFVVARQPFVLRAAPATADLPDNDNVMGRRGCRKPASASIANNGNRGVAMRLLRRWNVGFLCALGLAGPALAATLTLSPASETVPINGARTFTATLSGSPAPVVKWKVNGVAGGSAVTGTISSSGVYTAPAAVPQSNPVTVTATTTVKPTTSGSASVTVRLPIPWIYGVSPVSVPLGAYTLSVNGDRFYSGAAVWVNGVALPTTYVSMQQLKATGTAAQVGTLSLEVVNPGNVHSAVSTSVQAVGTGPPPPPPGTDPAAIAAARFLEQATFGATPNDIAAVKQAGTSAWMTQQLALPASPLAVTTDLNVLRRNWYANMASGPDQVRQRMIFALSQIFVVSADKNPYGNEMLPWLQTLSSNALGNFNALLREMTLNPSMGKYLDLGNSVMPSPNENYPREVLQLFTLGLYLLNPDGTVQLDGNANPIPTYDQARIHDIARALSGWTYPGTSATGLNWENFTGPLQPRDSYHDRGAKTLLSGVTLPAGQTAQQDYDAVMQNIFAHPNLPPFIATRLIRALVTSNPSPAYVQRVAGVFADNGGGVRGDLAATARAVLLDTEARSAALTPAQGHLKDPILHSLGLIRALGGTVIDPSNLFWDYFLLSEKLLNAPSVFNFYSPLTRVPGSPQYYGPEFQIYASSLAIGRANFLYALISGSYNSMIAVDITPFVNVAADATALVNLVDATLLQGRMSAVARAAIATALAASTDNRQRAITALYLTAITAEFAVHQ
jgi:uncharacterized protein (DUF1800 family)